MSAEPLPEVSHIPAGQRFEIRFPEAVSVLEYRVDGMTVDFWHTEVPPALRGRGLAEKLVRAGLAWAEQSGLKVIPSCSYVAAFLARQGRDASPRRPGGTP